MTNEPDEDVNKPPTLNRTVLVPKRVTNAPPPPKILSGAGSSEPPNSDSAYWARKAGKPDWSFWSNLAVVSFSDACYLSLDIDPSGAQQLGDNAVKFPGVLARCKIAKSNLGRRLKSHMTDSDEYYEKASGTGVTLSEFRAWGESLPSPLTFPDEFPRLSEPQHLGEEANGEIPERPSVVRSDPAKAAKEIDPRERTTLLCIIGALARHHEFDLSQPNKAGDAVAAMAPELDWTGRSIGVHLKRVQGAMDSRKR